MALPKLDTAALTSSPAPIHKGKLERLEATLTKYEPICTKLFGFVIAALFMLMGLLIALSLLINHPPPSLPEKIESLYATTTAF